MGSRQQSISIVFYGVCRRLPTCFCTFSHSFFHSLSSPNGSAKTLASGAPFRNGGKNRYSPLDPPTYFCSYEMLTQPRRRDLSTPHFCAMRLLCRTFAAPCCFFLSYSFPTAQKCSSVLILMIFLLAFSLCSHSKFA